LIGERVAVATFVTVLVLGLAGCATLETQQQSTSQTQQFSERELLNRLIQRNDRLRSLRSLAKISYRSGSEKGGFQGAIVVDRPDRLRLEAFSMFGTALVVTAAGNRVTGFYPSENRVYRGESSRQNLFRYTQVLLDLKELTSLLVGMPPIEADARWEVTRTFVQRRLRDGSLDIVELSTQTGVPVRWERFARTGAIQFSAVFQEFSKTSLGAFPLKISFAAPALGRLVEVRYDEPEINASLPDSVFIQNPPENATEVSLDALGG